MGELMTDMLGDFYKRITDYSLAVMYSITQGDEQQIEMRS